MLDSVPALVPEPPWEAVSVAEDDSSPVDMPVKLIELDETPLLDSAPGEVPLTEVVVV